MQKQNWVCVYSVEEVWGWDQFINRNNCKCDAILWGMELLTDIEEQIQDFSLHLSLQGSRV